MYAARDIEKHTMVIEYIGTIIRNEVANRKEKLYESQVRAGVCSPFLSPSPFYHSYHKTNARCLSEEFVDHEET